MDTQVQVTITGTELITMRQSEYITEREFKALLCLPHVLPVSEMQDEQEIIEPPVTRAEIIHIFSGHEHEIKPGLTLTQLSELIETHLHEDHGQGTALTREQLKEIVEGNKEDE